MKGLGELEDGEWRPPPIDQQEEENGQPWQEVRNMKRVVPRSGGRYEYGKDVVVFFVANLPNDCSTVAIKEAFKNHGRMADVYLPGRRDKNGKGNLFAFVKYSGVRDVRQLEAALNKVTIGGAKLSVNIAKFDRNKKPIVYQKLAKKSYQQEPTKIWVQKDQLSGVNTWGTGANGLSYRDKLLGRTSSNNNTPTINMDDTPDHMVKNLDGVTVIGRLKRWEVLDKFVTELDGKLGYASSVRYVGGMRLMLSFVESEDAKEYCNDRSSWGPWFHSVVLWTQEYKKCERIARIRIFGVPLSLWTCETFERIAKRYGPIVHHEGCNWTIANHAYHEVDILVKSGERIRDNVLIEKGSDKFMVWVNETDYDWQPSCLATNERMAYYESELKDTTKENYSKCVEDPVSSPENRSGNQGVHKTPSDMDPRGVNSGAQDDNGGAGGSSPVKTDGGDHSVDGQSSSGDPDSHMAVDSEQTGMQNGPTLEIGNKLNVGAKSGSFSLNSGWAPGLIGLTPSFGPFSSRKRPRCTRSPSSSPNNISPTAENAACVNPGDPPYPSPVFIGPSRSGPALDRNDDDGGTSVSQDIEETCSSDVIPETRTPSIDPVVLKEINDTISIGECIGIRAAPFADRFEEIINGEDKIQSK
ncbi:hypothetical protein SSX86_003076 [Deinandra increscens subsp. villosa]|uniref:RRM domain-containing protein n=1 Tax=Deinandra increscens subsp. villosa TaxID=3103831 RepID=A0AAP0H4M8_9ASTR